MSTPARSCGGCTLCCKLLAVNELGKLAGQHCQHQSAAKGCKVYHDSRRMPGSCRLWNCQWIIGQLPRDLRRPDRAHYVVDMIPDYVNAVFDNETINIPVVQVWCDPDFPNAHRDPALRAWLDAERTCALIRFSASYALFIAPPSVNSEGVWYEDVPRESGEKQHALDDILAVTGARVRVEIEP